jgi:hypothetical protein
MISFAAMILKLSRDTRLLRFFLLSPTSSRITAKTIAPLHRTFFLEVPFLVIYATSILLSWPALSLSIHSVYMHAWIEYIKIYFFENKSSSEKIVLCEQRLNGPRSLSTLASSK